ncbi:MAG: hypothetical protein D6722_03930 [Bacteroidetes bacterium]|nr:MAG: hypothetical protein D6722_03930 [Bacteroidota bacterium]
MALITIHQCPSCGASVAPKQERCSYCDNYLLHLTPLERRGSPAPDAGADAGYFRSLRWFYGVLLVAGLAGAFYIYVLHFDDFSETEMVQLSPFWFVAMVWGLGGLFAERAVRAVLRGEAKTFMQGLTRATKGLVPIVALFVYLLFFPPFFLLGLHRWKLSSPLLIGLAVSLLWGVGLFVFLYGIFPSL